MQCLEVVPVDQHQDQKQLGLGAIWSFSYGMDGDTIQNDRSAAQETV